VAAVEDHLPVNGPWPSTVSDRYDAFAVIAAVKKDAAEAKTAVAA
jgi:hypothetical protein